MYQLRPDRRLKPRRLLQFLAFVRRLEDRLRAFPCELGELVPSGRGARRSDDECGGQEADALTVQANGERSSRLFGGKSGYSGAVSACAAAPVGDTLEKGDTMR